MTITQYNSNNSLIPEFKWSLFEKGNYLGELINIPIKAEERSMIQIWFRTQDLNIKTGTIRNSRQNSHLIHDPLCFQNPRIHSIYRKNPQSVCFLRPNPSIRRPIHPPLNMTIKQHILFNDYTLSQQRVPYTFFVTREWAFFLCVKREWAFIFSVIRESIFFCPWETGFRFFRDLWKMHLLSRDLWTIDFCGNNFSHFWRF